MTGISSDLQVDIIKDSESLLYFYEDCKQIESHLHWTMQNWDTLKSQSNIYPEEGNTLKEQII